MAPISRGIGALAKQLVECNTLVLIIVNYYIIRSYYKT